MSIKVEKPVIDEAVLDLIGKEFKFDHAKGIAELLKNSVDAYNMEGISDEQQIIYIYLNLSKNNLVKSIDVIDFVGMNRTKIDAAFKRWFDPNAAKKISNDQQHNIKTLGGHGNGGKFYMREMFKSSSLITYRSARLNSFGFNEQKQYGFDSQMNNIEVNIDEAIEISELQINSNLYDEIKNILFERKRFTIVRGIQPKSAHKTNYLKDLINKLIVHPQAKRIIQHKQVFLLIGQHSKSTRLKIPTLLPKKGFEGPFEFVCPQTIDYEGEKIKMYSNEPIKLTLLTSEEPLKGSKFRGRNSIDFLSDVGVIANYEISKIGHFRTYVYSEFIHGECNAQVMENEKYVTNDRNEFIGASKTEALLNWTKECIESLCEKMEDSAKREKKKINLKKTSELNELLNKWKNRFLQKLIRDRLAGVGNDIGMGGASEEAWSGDPQKKNQHKKDSTRKIGNEGGDKVKKINTFPEVRISGMHPDPFSESNEPFDCDQRQPAIYQRPIDFKNGIYWINTSKHIANMILEKNGPDSIRWREYLFQRYIDIIVKEAIYFLGKTDADFTSDTVMNEIDRVTSEALDLAAVDLNSFLFEEVYIV
ncbi:MAG: ATP-binding protein [Ignavibacteriales bacterium]|nr:ATP-binding protein [Ignavibacteriales bacterium]